MPHTTKCSCPPKQGGQLLDGNGVGQSSFPHCVLDPFGRRLQTQVSTMRSTIWIIWQYRALNLSGQNCFLGLFDLVQPLAEKLKRERLKNVPSTRKAWIKVTTILDNGESNYRILQEIGLIKSVSDRMTCLAEGTLFRIHSHQQPISDMIQQLSALDASTSIFFSTHLAVQILFSSLFVVAATVIGFLRHCTYVHLYCLTCESDNLPYLLSVEATENSDRDLHG